MNKLIFKKIKQKTNLHLLSNTFKTNKTLAFNFRNFSTSKIRKTQGPYKENNLKAYVNYVRKHSYRFAQIDPLNINNKEKTQSFSPEFWGLSELEKIEEFPMDESATFTNEIVNNLNTIKDLYNFLNKNYLKNVGVEFEQIDDEDEKLWLYENYEYFMEKEVSQMELHNAFKILYPAMVRLIFLQ